jgi:hypothetical protein
MSAHADVRSNIVARKITAWSGARSSPARLERCDGIFDGRGRGRAKEADGRQLVRLLCARSELPRRQATDLQ